MLTLCTLALVSTATVGIHQFFVSSEGNDANAGTLAKPFATIQRAQLAIRGKGGVVYLRGGTYYLSSPLVFTAADSGSKPAPVIYQSYQDEDVVLSGGVRLHNLDWQPVGNGIFRTQVPADLETEEIFVDGKRQILARYPNFDSSAKYFDGFASDAISKERAARWKNPAGGYFHAMHPALWGDFTWKITGKNAAGEPTLEGGWQNNRGSSAHRDIRFVENIFEELDSPGEWFLDSKKHTLYFFPPKGVDPKAAVFEATRLRSLVEFRGDQKLPVRWITLRGMTFRHAARTVMETREPVLRSDWAIYRGGAIFFNGSEDCALEDSWIDQVAGNAVFVNDYNRRVTIRGTHISKAGASGICFLGDPRAARNPLFNYDQVQDLASIDRTRGPKSDNYPADCRVEECLIHETGRVEKQTAGVAIDLAQGITIRHCSIYDMPRAGINIGDGCWGGHTVEWCDVFDTVRETGDHGSFNSWGRDRFWRPNIDEVNAWVKQEPALPFLDVEKPNILRNNRWRCDHGWDIDLDDGSSNYIIRNNLCLNGGIKNREGFGRVVENNIMVQNGFHPHVWYAECGDVFRRNIVEADYQPALMHEAPWGKEMDFNLRHQPGQDSVLPARHLQEQSGRDERSVAADAMFMNPATGDYRVKRGSPALTLGFVNFPMDKFGVQNPRLKAMARTPRLPAAGTITPSGTVRSADPVTWRRLNLRNVTNEGEISAFGLPRMTGVIVVEVPEHTAWIGAGLRKNDVILTVNGVEVTDTRSLPSLPEHGEIRCTVLRDQREVVIRLKI